MQTGYDLRDRTPYAPYSLLKGNIGSNLSYSKHNNLMLPDSYAKG